MSALPLCDLRQLCTSLCLRFLVGNPEVIIVATLGFCMVSTHGSLYCQARCWSGEDDSVTFVSHGSMLLTSCCRSLSPQVKLQQSTESCAQQEKEMAKVEHGSSTRGARGVKGRKPQNKGRAGEQKLLANDSLILTQVKKALLKVLVLSSLLPFSSSTNHC